MIYRGVAVNAKARSNGRTALHLLCQYYLHDNLMRIFELTIANGADLDERSKYGITASDVFFTFLSFERERKSNILELFNTGQNWWMLWQPWWTFRIKTSQYKVPSTLILYNAIIHAVQLRDVELYLILIFYFYSRFRDIKGHKESVKFGLERKKLKILINPLVIVL